MACNHQRFQYFMFFLKGFHLLNSKRKASKLRSNIWRCSVRKSVLRDLAKFLEKGLCRSLCLQSCRPQTCKFIKIETLAQVFSCEFCEISKNTFLTEHVWASALQATMYKPILKFFEAKAKLVWIFKVFQVVY